MKISIGDKVRLIEVDAVDEMCGLYIGQEFEVIEVDFDINHPIIVRLPDRVPHPLSMEQLEVVG